MWKVFADYLAFRQFGAIVIEHGLLVCCVLASIQIRLNQYPDVLHDYDHPFLKAILIALTCQLFLHLRDVYDFGMTASMGQLWARLGQGILLAGVGLSVLFFFVPDLMVGRGILLINLGLTWAVLTVWHTLLRLYFGKRAPHSRILVLGTGHLGVEVVREILRHPERGIGVCGFLDDNPALIGSSVVNPKVLGSYKDVLRIASANNVDRIVVEVQDRRGHLPIGELLSLKTRGVAVEDATSLYERLTGRIAIQSLKPSWMIFNDGFEISTSVLRQRRILAFVVALGLLVLLTPVMFLTMVLIKFDSRGPIFHRQERVGQGGRIFTLWKFRSMHQDAELETGPVWATENDKRVTRVGRLLRRTRVDELPQLWNVLLGDMSLVGPRPERPHFVNELAGIIPFYHLRHAIKPGVTGWAQVNYHYGNSVQDAVEKLQYDLFYIKNMSWVLDSLILFETLKTILVRKGS